MTNLNFMIHCKKQDSPRNVLNYIRKWRKVSLNASRNTKDVPSLDFFIYKYGFTEVHRRLFVIHTRQIVIFSRFVPWSPINLLYLDIFRIIWCINLNLVGKKGRELWFVNEDKLNIVFEFLFFLIHY